MKTSSFPSADALDGAELIGVVQDETNVKATAVNVSSVMAYRPYVLIGFEAALYGFSSIAIGQESSAMGSTSSMAIGDGSQSAGLALSIGSPGYVTGNNSLLIGGYSFNPSATNGMTMLGEGNEGGAGGYGTLIGTSLISDFNIVAVGRDISPDGGGEGGVFVGAGFSMLEANDGVAIGNTLGVYGPQCVGIGLKSKAMWKGVAIGYNSGFQNVPFYAAGEASIAIGCNVYTPAGPTIGIGYNILSVYSGVGLGKNILASDETVAIGYGVNGEGTRGVGIGVSLSSADNNVAMGSYYCHAYRPYVMVFGSTYDPPVNGTFVNAGVRASTMLRPMVFHEKFIGNTICAKSATAGWGDGSYLATVSYLTPGVGGNSYTLTLADNGADESLATSFSDGTISILLATNDPSTNTLANIGALFPTNGFGFSYTSGYGATVVSFTFTSSFANGTDGAPTATLTTDGLSPGGSNMPAIYENSLATITGTVVGTTASFFDSSGDAANFTLGPVMVVQKNDGSYSFIGTPTFTMTSNTSGASGWDAPVLSLTDENTLLVLGVENTEADVNWMAHLTFEAGNSDES